MHIAYWYNKNTLGYMCIFQVLKICYCISITTVAEINLNAECCTEINKRNLVILLLFYFLMQNAKMS